MMFSELFLIFIPQLGSLTIFDLINFGGSILSIGIAIYSLIMVLRKKTDSLYDAINLLILEFFAIAIVNLDFSLDTLNLFYIYAFISGVYFIVLINSIFPIDDRFPNLYSHLNRIITAMTVFLFEIFIFLCVPLVKDDQDLLNTALVPVAVVLLCFILPISIISFLWLLIVMKKNDISFEEFSTTQKKGGIIVLYAFMTPIAEIVLIPITLLYTISKVFIKEDETEGEERLIEYGTSLDEHPWSSIMFILGLILITISTLFFYVFDLDLVNLILENPYYYIGTIILLIFGLILWILTYLGFDSSKITIPILLLFFVISGIFIAFPILNPIFIATIHWVAGALGQTFIFTLNDELSYLTMWILGAVALISLTIGIIVIWIKFGKSNRY